MNKRIAYSVYAALLLAFALRVFQLDAQSMWWDELAPVVIVRLPFPQWLVPVFQDRGHPPGFYMLLSVWTQLGAGEFFVRFLSVFLGVLAVAFLARLGTRIGRARAGLFAAGIMALSPFYVWYAQESRMYALLIFSTLASSWAFVELLHRPRWTWGVALFVFDLIGLYSHYLFGLFLLTQLVFMLMGRGRYRRPLRYWMAATFGAGFLFLFWVAALQLAPIQGRPNLDWIPNARWYDPVLSLYAVLLGASQDPGFILNWVTPLLAVAMAIYGVKIYWKTTLREPVLYLLVWLVAPWLFLYIVSLPVPNRSLYVDRYLTAFVPPLLLLIALGAAALWERNRAVCGVIVAVGLLPVLFSLTNMYSAPRYARDDWRGVSAYLQLHADPARDALLTDVSQTLPFEYYPPGSVKAVERPLGDESQLRAWVQAHSTLSAYSRLWLVTVAAPINVHRFYPDPAGQIEYAREDPFKRLLETRYRVENEQWFPGLLLTTYRVQP